MVTATAEMLQKEALQKSKEVLGKFPHLTISSPRMVSLADIAHNDLIIEDDKGNNISDQDYVKDESKSTKEKAVFVRRRSVASWGHRSDRGGMRRAAIVQLFVETTGYFGFHLRLPQVKSL